MISPNMKLPMQHLEPMNVAILGTRIKFTHPMLLCLSQGAFIMEPILKSCAGMDVHEKKVDVCIAHGPFDKPPKFEIRTFSTMTRISKI